MRHSQLSKCSMHSCSSMGYLARSMSQATVEVMLSRQQAGEVPRGEAVPGPDRRPRPCARPGGHHACRLALMAGAGFRVETKNWSRYR